jgi:pilus assembly protein Flp/PilA
MLKFLFDTTGARLLSDQRGVTSFEYVILAACIVAIVSSVFNGGASDSIKNTLTNALNTIGAAVISAVGG